LDACCAINLFATGRVQELVTELPHRFALVDVVKAESLYVRRGGLGDDAQDLVLVDWSPLVDAGQVVVLTLEGEAEENAFVELAANLDDGEAATCALAVSRGYAVATDDRRARSLLAARAPQLRVYSTLDIVRQWCDQRALGANEIAVLLQGLRERGRFLPPRHDPLRPWWDQFYGQ
jgi:predicted nucleic acid-binding protein